MRRNKGAFAAAAVFLALLTGLGLSAWQAVRARNAEQAARRAEQAERAQSEQARANRDRAVVSEQSARRNLYAADMNLGPELLASGELSRAIELLERYRPAGSGVREQESANKPPPSVLTSDPRGWEWRYLWGQSRSDELATLCRQEGYVSGMVYDRHTGKVITVDKLGRIRLYHFPSGRLLGELQHPGTYVVLALSPDGRKLVSADYGSAIVLWDLKTAQPVLTITNRWNIETVVYSPDGT